MLTPAWNGDRILQASFHASYTDNADNPDLGFRIVYNQLSTGEHNVAHSVNPGEPQPQTSASNYKILAIYKWE